MTLFALLELYKQGEATWTQDEPFGDDRDPRAAAPSAAAAGGGGVTELRARSRRCCSFAPSRCRPSELAEALRGAEADEVARGAGGAGERHSTDRGLVLRELAGGWTLATDPLAEEAARRLLAKPRTPPLTPAQAETLAIVAYLQPVSRPEITRIRGVSAESAAATLLERGLIEESGRSQFGAVLYRTTPLFLKLFGLRSLDELPDVAEWDPTPERGGRPARAPAARRRGPLGSPPGQPGLSGRR